jgi:hypothetical protein
MTGLTFEPIFFHFHALKRISSTEVSRGEYELSKRVVESLYDPYVQKLVQLDDELKSKFEVPLAIRALPKVGMVRKVKNQLAWIKRSFH